MSGRTKLGLAVAEAALVMGLLGDALLRATPWGLNVLLWTAALVTGAHALARRKGARTLAGEGAWLWPVAVLFAGFFAWRDSLTLRLLDTLVVLAALALAAAGARGARVRLAGVADYVVSAVTAAFGAVFGVFPLVFSDVKWKEIPQTGWSKHALAVTRGLLIAAPLLLLFGGLLIAADALYEGLVRETFNLDAGIAFSHLLLFGFFTWITAGFLRGLLLAGRPITSDLGGAVFTALNLTKMPDAETPAGQKPAGGGAETAGGTARTVVSEAASETERHIEAAARGGYRFSAGDENGSAAELPRTSKRGTAAHEGAARGETKATDAGATRDANAGAAHDAEAGASPTGHAARARFSLGIVEIGVVLGLIDLLFFSFVAVQLRYLFGDARHVITSAGLTFSDYARRGFFELVWVALLALPMLLAAHWLLRKDNPLSERVFRGLAGVMVALLFAVMASGLWRMRLYQQAYGQTELRFYTTAFMLWLGVVFVWFTLTVLRGRRERFACGALVVWLVALGVLHVVNPDDVIVRTNVAQAQALNRPERFDSEYAVSISADAVPALVELLPEMSPRDRAYVAARLTSWLEPGRTGDWRSWNFARARARRLVAESEPTLRVWEARWRAEMKAAETAAASARAQARRHSETAQAPVTGTPYLIRIERYTEETPGTPAAGARRTVMLVAASTGPLATEMVVSSLSLPAADGKFTRIEILRASDSMIYLREAGGVYAVDLARRTVSASNAADVPQTGGLTSVGAFDIDANNVWRFTPSSGVGRQAPAVHNAALAAQTRGR